ncbi:hypothetical protein Tco_1167301 [Tanacetum coccineum]
MVAFLEKSTGSEGFHQVIDFLNRSHICYALTKKPDVYISFIKQFWRSAEATNDDNGEVQITATIDGHSKTITEASLRRHLKLDDHDGITSIPNSEIFEQLALMGYHTDSDKLTFQKGAFSPQWRFLIHTILHCLSPKKTAWEQFSSNIATAVICLATNRRYNFSRGLQRDIQAKKLLYFLLCYNVSELPLQLQESSSSTFTLSEPSFEHSPDHTTAAVSFTSLTQPSPRAEQHIPTPNESPLHAVYSHGSDEGSLKLNELTNLVTKLSERMMLGQQGKELGLSFLKMMKMLKMILPNRGGNYLMQRFKRKQAHEKLTILSRSASTLKFIQDQGSSWRKGFSEVSNAWSNKEKRTRKDKGKAIMTEPEPKKKSKKELEQERQWNEEEGQRAMSEAKSSKKTDWNDPSVIRYHALKMKPKTVVQARRNMVKYLKNQGNYKISDFKGMSYNEIRPIFEKVWDFNQHIEPMDLEHGSERMKSPEKIEEEDVDTQKEMKEVSKESGAKRKKSLPRKSTRSTVKRQKMELDDEKEDLKGYLDIVPREDVAEDVESLSTKYPIVDWKTYTLSENFIQDIMELYRLVKERYSSSRPEGYDLMLWGDLHTLFEPDEESEIWMNQNEYNLISWSLCDFCGVHILLMQNGIAIHMLTEKKYPLSQEMLSKMMSKRLEVDHASTQAYELPKFIRSQVQK